MKAYLLEISLTVVAILAHVCGRPRAGLITLLVVLARIWLRAEKERRAKERLLREVCEITELLRRCWLVWR